MKTMKFFLSCVLISSIILFYSFPVVAQESEEHHWASDEAELAETPVPPDTMTPIPKQIASDEATLESTPEATIGATLTPTPATQIALATGDATSETKTDTKVNTNIIGKNNCFIVLNLFENPDSPVDLSTMIPTDCHAGNDATGEAQIQLANTNTTIIQEQVDQTVDTGNNTSNAGGGSIKTGDATAAAYISNLANTNIVGSNTLFGVINIYKPTSSDIILPYEYSFLNAGGTTPVISIANLQNNNQATVQNTIDAHATTGENTSADSIKTGDGTVLIRMANNLNTNILNSNFFLLQINNLVTGQGQTAALNFPIGYKQATNAAKINNENQATIDNNIHLTANTGGNSAEGNGGTISTGNATAKAFISNIANTTIIGNNWYHMIVNIFDTFTGKIVLPRPDVATAMSAKTIGDHEVEVTVRFGNVGNLAAHEVQVISQLPENAEVLNKPSDTQIDGSRLYWNLGTLEKQQIDARTFTVRITQPGQYTIASRIATSTDEPNKDNNNSSVRINVAEDIPYQGEPKELQPSIQYIRSIITPLPRYSQTTQYEEPQIQKLLPSQLRSIPGQVKSVSNSHNIISTHRASMDTFLSMFLVYLISGIVGIYKMLRQ